jgi:hypothetical protein
MLHIIAVAYERPIPMRIFIDCLLIQTDQNWRLYIMYDGPAPQDIQEVIGLYKDPRIKFYCSRKRNQNFGHPNRRMMLEKLHGENDDFVLLTNEDNYYIPSFIECMMQQATRTIGLVYCDTIHSHFQYTLHKSELKCGYIDMGAFIVRYPIAKSVGFRYDDFAADGMYAEECANACKINNLDIIHINKPIFIHN